MEKEMNRRFNTTTTATNHQKDGLQTIYLLFGLASSSIEDFYGASESLDDYCRHIHSTLLNKKYVI